MEWTLEDYENAAIRGQSDHDMDDGTVYFDAEFTDHNGFTWGTIRVEMFDDGDVWAHPVPWMGY